jgi:hypothetical protein
LTGQGDPVDGSKRVGRDMRAVPLNDVTVIVIMGRLYEEELEFLFFYM